MKTTKLITACCLVWVAINVNAQKNHQKMNTDSLAQKYALTEVQKQQLKEAKNYLKPQRDSVKTMPNKKANHSIKQKLNRQWDSIIKVIFTPTQYDNFTKDKEIIKQEKNKAKVKARAQYFTDSLDKNLNLSLQQKAAVNMAYTRYFESKTKETIKEDRKALKTELKSILNEEQQKKLHAVKKNNSAQSK